MAHDEVFAGPVSESVPSSITGFAHRQSRSDSIASFTYFQERESSPDWLEEDEIIDQSDVDSVDSKFLEDEQDTPSVSLERRRSSGFSRRSVEDPLLYRNDSTRTDSVGFERDNRTNQKIYVISEDLTIVVAGFRTSSARYSLYIILCTITLGLGFLLLRWLPRWRVRLIGSPKALRDCPWVAVETQGGDFTVHDVSRSNYGHSLSTVFGSMKRDSSRAYDEDDDPVMPYLRFLDYRYMRFWFHPLKDKFVLGTNWKDPKWVEVRSMRAGLNGEERHRREQVFGRNEIDIQQKSIPQILIDEAFHPFYIFQIASLTLWSLDEYYYYAICIFILSVFSITTTLIETRSTMKRLRNLSRFECEVRVLRNSFWRQIASMELVPGDVYEVSDPYLSQLPCDSLLLAGDCIVNESMLTGESVPVTKIPATNESMYHLDLAADAISGNVAKHFLFGGTKIIRARRPQGGQDDEAVALALVVRTGFNTTKGALVRSILFPKPLGFKFYRDAFRYISVMAGVAGIGFVVSFINFIRLGLALHLIIVRALDLITIVVPPALPATLSIGTNFALSRLKRKKIFCISPQRVNIGGKLDVICFDKTGTLTEDDLDVLGLRIIHQPTKRFGDLLNNLSLVVPESTYDRDPTMDYETHNTALYVMATCHSLRKVNDELLGDPLDVKMFEFTHWTFEENTQLNDVSCSVARPPVGIGSSIYRNDTSTRSLPLELGILKSFEFVSHLRRASVIVQRNGESGGDIYVKGAPECMKEICHSSSFPKDYEELLSFYTHRGFRVIACATKHLQNLNKQDVQEIKRADAESNLNFIGFIIFENKLKTASCPIIKELNDAGIRQVMCTGDNLLTAISVARECNLVNRTAHCFVPHFIEGGPKDFQARLKWQSVDNSLLELDEHTLLPLPPPAESDASLPYEMSNIRNYALAISGDVFRWVVDYGSEEVLKRMLAHSQIYARMSPDEKHELVEKLQSLDYCCGFCGDGANDCGALKAADVGISLSEAEASVAAPFTSQVFDISCVPEIIREGRAALVTSFCCFKYMSLYSAIQFTSVSILYASASNLGDFQYLFIDLFLILPIAIFMGWTGAYPILCRKRPTASLVSRKVLVPLLGQALICMLVQLVSIICVRRQTWYIPPTINPHKSNVENSEDTNLFLISCFQYIFCGIVLSTGPPFRQPAKNNIPFVVTIILTLLFSSYLLLDPGTWVADLMDLTHTSLYYKGFILLLALAGFVCAWVAEKYWFRWIARMVDSIRNAVWPSRRKTRKEYKTILEDMRI